MASVLGFPTLNIATWLPPDKSGYMEQLSKKAPALVAPADRIMYDALSKVPVTGYQYDWLTDDLATIGQPPGIAFDTEPAYATQLLRNRLNNIIQMFRKVWSVSEYSEIIAKNGGIGGNIVSEISRQVMLKTRELIREIERMIGSNNTGALQTAAGAGPTMNGYFYSLTLGNSTLSKTNTVDNYAATPAQDLSQFLGEDTFRTKVKTLYKNGASADLWFVSTPEVVYVASLNWQGRSQVRETVARGDHKVDTVLEKYVAPVGGEVTFAPDRSLGDCGLLMDREQISIGVADPIRVFKSDPGSFQNMYGRIRTYLTLMVGNPQASGGWTTDNTNNSAGE